MNYSIEKKDSFRVIGLRLKTNFHEDERSLKEIPPFWGQAHQSGDIKKIVSLMNTDIKGMFGICGVQIDESKDFYYYIAAASDAPMPDGMCEYTVPASTWAIFEGKGPMPVSIQELQRKIYTEWLPTSGYEYNTSAPDIEVYSDGDQSSPENKFWVWFPVIKK